MEEGVGCRQKGNRKQTKRVALERMIEREREGEGGQYRAK